MSDKILSSHFAKLAALPVEDQRVGALVRYVSKSRTGVVGG